MLINFDKLPINDILPYDNRTINDDKFKKLIIGTVVSVSGAAVLATAGVLCFCYCKKSRKRRQVEDVSSFNDVADQPNQSPKRDDSPALLAR